MSPMMRRFLVTAAAFAAAPMMFAACGDDTECGAGTTDQDGTCVATNPTDAITCGDGTTLDAETNMCTAEGGDGTTCGTGTTLRNGVCTADPVGDTSCGDGTMLVGGVCLPEVTCGAGTTPMNGMCVANGSVTCGEGTMLDTGTMECVALGDSSVTCGTNTMVVDGECRPTSMVCATGSTFNEADGTCTVDGGVVCAMGTSFDMASGTCVPDASVCGAGRTLLMGVCVTPFEQALGEADETIDEIGDGINDDVTIAGGVARALTLTPGTGNTLTIAGQINTPRDIDMDGSDDQDLDDYAFTATAGSLYQVSVQQGGGASVGFSVSGPEGYERFAPVGFGTGATRQIWIPRDGDYTISVGPAASLLGQLGPFGADDDYILTVEELAAPTPTVVDFATQPAVLSGTAADLSDNLFQIQNATPGDLVLLDTVIGDAVDDDVIVQFWENATTLSFELDGVGDGERFSFVTPSADYLIFVDWEELNGSDTSFELSLTRDPNQTSLGPIAAGMSQTTTPLDISDSDIYTYSFTAAPGELIEISHVNTTLDSGGTNPEELDVSVRDVDGNFIASDFSLEASTNTTSPEYLSFLAPEGGTYLIEIETSGSTGPALTGIALTIDSSTPNSLGALVAGTPATFTRTAPLTEGRIEAHVFTLTDIVDLSASLDAAGVSDDAELRLYGADGRQLLTSVTAGLYPRMIGPTILFPGTYYVLVQATGNDLELGYTATFTPEASTAEVEMEPNDTDAMATSVSAPATLDAPTLVAGVLSSPTDIDTFLVPAGTTGLMIFSEDDDDVDAVSFEIVDVATQMVLEMRPYVAVPTTGDVIIRVTNPDPGVAVGGYSFSLLSAQIEVEPNDTIATANTLPLDTLLNGTGGDDPIEPNEYVMNNEPYDYFSVDLTSFTAADMVDLTVTIATYDSNGNSQDTGSIRARLYDAAGMFIGQTGGADDVEVFTVSGGATYYLGIAQSFEATFNTNYLLSATAALTPVTP